MFVFRKPLFTVTMAPKHKSSDAGSASNPKRSSDILSISEKVKILDMIEVEIKSYAEISRLCGKKESSITAVMENKEKIRVSFSAESQTAKVTAIVHVKVLMKVEKALNFWVEDMNIKRVPVDGNLLRQIALSPYKDFQKKDGTEEATKPFAASRGSLHGFRNRFNLKNIKIV